MAGLLLLSLTLLVLTLCSQWAAARPRPVRTPLITLPNHPDYATPFERLGGVPYEVTYDDRAVIVNGERQLLISGCIHYPRFAEAEWAHQFNLSRQAGLNAVQTYVFWNWHEAEKRQYDWTSEGHNLGRFIELAAEYGLFVYLRVGPFVCSEWTYGGIPLWLREDKSMVYRTNNTAWEYEMNVFVNVVMRYIQPYLPRNGGNIILAQIENEYDNMEGNDAGNKAYIQWAGHLTQSFDTGLVWGACSTHDIPRPVIPTCNGLDCYNWMRRNRTQPAIWTEHWSAEAWTWHWGSHLPHNSAENMAYAAAYWYAEGGAYMSYYMWSGGTTWGRMTGGPLLVNSYDYEAPVDEYGLPTPDKFPHLAALHFILQAYASVIIQATNGIDREVALSANVSRFDYGDAQFGLLFLVNKVNSPQSVVVTTDRQRKVQVPASAVLIFDWTTFDLLYDSSDVPHSRRVTDSTGLFTAYLPPTEATVASPLAPSAPSPAYDVAYWPEPSALWSEAGVLTSVKPLELLDISRQRSDHAYYQTKVTLTAAQVQKGSLALQLRQVTNHFHAFFDGRFVGFGSVDGQLSVQVAELKANAAYNLTLVVQQNGVENCCGGLEAFNEGILGDVQLDGRSLLANGWWQLVGLQGEALQLPSSPTSSLWNDSASAPTATPWVWYRARIATPDPSPAAWVTYQLDLTSSMGKGQVWINGKALGRYWNITDENGRLSQAYNHVPAAWLRPPTEANWLVMWEELGGDPSRVTLSQRM